VPDLHTDNEDAKEEIKRRRESVALQLLVLEGEELGERLWEAAILSNREDKTSVVSLSQRQCPE